MTRARLVPAAFAPWVVGAGSALLCVRCGAEVRAPLPRLDVAGYNRMVEQFIRHHSACQARVELTTRTRGAA